MKIRINQDVTFNWKLTVGGESVDLSKLELSVEITTPSNKKVEINPNIQFDTLEFNYRPKQVGEYILSAYLNRFKDGETALDIKAFEGVKYTWNQDFSIDDNLEANYVELAGDFNFGPNVPSAPDVPSVDLSDYAKTTYVDTQINNEATARTQADSELQSKINTKQDTLTAGENIKIENNVISAIDLRPSVDLSDYAKTSYVDTQINNESTARTQADSELQSKINTKQDTLTAGDNIKIENNVISAISVAKISLNTTWSELKGMRDNSQLVAGKQYRITDYTCTTTQAATKSAGHVFDIIVTADSTNALNEEARAIQHEGDTYFADSNLSAWKIWYCIDNDTNRFAWADSTNGKGVIYRMIDEFNNDVPYDFKNIQFYRQYDSSKSLWSTISSDNSGVPCYTFSSNGDSSTASFTDMSLSISNKVYSNVIKEYISYNKQTLNNICFFGTTFFKNTFDADCSENTFGNQCINNSFGNSCCTNSFRGGLWYNSFGKRCENNSFGEGCSYNTFGHFLTNNIFGDNCEFNSFGGFCEHNSFGNSCKYNSFGNYCLYISFGKVCRCNSFGNNCIYIKFASDSSATTKYTYYQNNHFGDGCKYIILKGAETASAESQVQNYNFSQGLHGSENAYITIDGKRGLTYETKVAKNSSGTLKIYCEADLSR